MSYSKIFYSGITEEELKNQIAEFNTLDFKNMTSGEVRQAVIKSLAPFMTMPTMRIDFPIGQRFYRARLLEHHATAKTPTPIEKESDCWNPPAGYVKLSRLNQDGESLLYTSVDPYIVSEEIGVKPSNKYALIVYESTTDIKTTSICRYEEYPDGHKKNSNDIIADFLRKEFSRKINPGEEYYYKITEAITKHFFDLPPAVHDAWHYISCSSLKGNNVCFPVRSLKKLKLVGVQIVTDTLVDGGKLFNVFSVGYPDKNGLLRFYKIGSKEQKNIFPEIKFN